MRSGLLVLLAATLALLWWVLYQPPAAEPFVPQSAEIPSAEILSAETQALSDPVHAAAFERGDLADLPITQREGFIPVQVWGISSPLPSAKVSILSFAQLGEVMMDTDLWPFIITADVVLKHGAMHKTGGNGVVQVPLSGSPCYVAAQVGNASAMATLIPATWNGDVVRLWVRPQPKLEVQVRYANGLPVQGVPVFLRSQDTGNNARLLGEDRLQRTAADGSAKFAMTETAQRILGTAGEVEPEIPALAAALGYTASEFDTLLPSQLSVVVPIFAGDRQTLVLPTPYDFSSPIVLTLPDAGGLRAAIHRADGSPLSGRAEISERRASGRIGQQRYTFLIPEDGAQLSSVALHRRFQLRVEIKGIGGEIVRVVDGPQSDGEIVEAVFIPDDVARIAAKLLNQKGEILANSSVKMVFLSGSRRQEIQTMTNAEGQLEAFVPWRLADQPISAVEILDVYTDTEAGSDQGSRIAQRSTRIALPGVLSSLEDLGTLTLK
jgi:hypothetical protein